MFFFFSLIFFLESSMHQRSSRRPKNLNCHLHKHGSSTSLMNSVHFVCCVHLLWLDRFNDWWSYAWIILPSHQIYSSNLTPSIDPLLYSSNNKNWRITESLACTRASTIESDRIISKDCKQIPRKRDRVRWIWT